MAEKKIAGVCAGIARYLQMDVTLVRILVAIFTVYPPGLGLIFYIVCWIIMPRDSYLPVHKNTGEVVNAAG
jgi:phage shock protein PspC (stress-responsive transcriptional regulator)